MLKYLKSDINLLVILLLTISIVFLGMPSEVIKYCLMIEGVCTSLDNNLVVDLSNVSVLSTINNLVEYSYSVISNKILFTIAVVISYIFYLFIKLFIKR